MNYNEAVKYIHSRLRFGMKPGLERIEKLLDFMGNPHFNMNFIHVAGTNGKGSTSAMIASSLTMSGKKTGLFTSPYISEFRERISIDGEMIPQEDLSNITMEMKSIIEKMENSGEIITEFELITAIALMWYREKNCDVVVLETGLGGRFDATNVIKNPLASVITKIALDHTAVLGDSIDKIAFEKCGIIKENGITVTYPEQDINALEVIYESSAKKNNRLICGNLQAVKILREDITGTEIEYGDLNIKIPLAGRHQIKNAVTAIETLKNLGVSSEDIVKGIGDTKFPARQEVISLNPLVILDGAHNPDGISTLKESLDRLLQGKKKIALMGMLEDKCIDKSLSIIAGCFDEIYAVEPENPRAVSAEIFAETARKYCKIVTVYNDKLKAVEDALSSLNSETALICCGSLYLAGEIRANLIEKTK